MPQNPVDTTLFVSKIVAGNGISVTPDSGTGIVTISTEGGTETFAQITVTGQSTLSTVSMGGLTATGLAALEAGLTVTGGHTTLGTTQVGGLTATGLATLGSLTVTANTTLPTTQVGTLTATQLGTFQQGITVTNNATLATTSVGTLTITQIKSLSVSGTVTANGVTGVVVSNTNVTANSQILLTLKTAGGTVGTPRVLTITPTTGFNFVSTASDSSTYNYTIIG